MLQFHKKLLGFVIEFNVSLNKKKNRDEVFISYLRKMISRMEKNTCLYKGKNYASNSIANYRKILRIWPDFEESMGVRSIRFSEIDMDVYSAFLEFCDTNNYMDSTKYQYASLIKAIMNSALEDGCSRNNIQNSKGFVTHRQSSVFRRVYLTREEIAALAGLDLQGNRAMEKVRDVFLVGCYTGQRFSDYSSMCIDEIETIDIEGAEFKALRKVQRKTGRTVVIPILDDGLLDIIQRWGGRLPKVSISDLNVRIKTLCRMAGVKGEISIPCSRAGSSSRIKKQKYELVSSHTARRSYITNLYMEGRLSTEQIRSISGHSSEDSFKRYLCHNLEDEAKEIIKRYMRGK